MPGAWSLALGSGEVTLLGMTEGEVLLSARPVSRRAVSEATAFLMTSMPSDLVNGGTGWQARRFGFARPRYDQRLGALRLTGRAVLDTIWVDIGI